jgi:hypothetical protein
MFVATADPSRDCFQIGRNSSPGCNDLVLSLGQSTGEFHAFDKKKKSTPYYSNGRFVNISGTTVKETHDAAGLVSRFACRIECERSPPHRLFLYASGYDEDRVSLPNFV